MASPRAPPRAPNSDALAAQIFAQLDNDGSGEIEEEELRRGLAAGVLVAVSDKADSVDMAAPGGGRRGVPVTAEPGIDIPAVTGSKVFRDWLSDVDTDPKLFVDDIHVQSVDMFGPNVGFIKFRSGAKVHVGGAKGAVSVPGIVFMRGGAVSVLVILECEGKEYTVLTRQARVPAADSALPEIPAGMLDGSGRFRGVAAEEIAVECNIEISENELVDLTELAYGDKYRGILPSAGGCDEFIRLFVCRRAVKPVVLQKLQGRLTGLVAEGEHIKLQILPAEEMWSVTPDAKALCALALFDRLKAEGKLPKSVQRSDTTAGGMDAKDVLQSSGWEEQARTSWRIHRARASSQVLGNRRSRSPHPMQRKMDDELKLLEIERLRSMFFEADADGNGVLDLEEFCTRLGKNKWLAGPDATKAKLTVLFKKMDANMDGMVEWDDFWDYMMLQSSDKSGEQDDYICQERIIARPEASQSQVNAIAHSPSTQHYYTSAGDSSIRVWSEDMEHQTTFRVRGSNRVHEMVVDPKGTMLVAATERAIAFVDLITLHKVDEIKCDAPKVKKLDLGLPEEEEIGGDVKCTPHCVTIWEYKGNSYVAFGDDVGTTYVATPPGRKAHDRRCGVLWSAKEHDGWVNKVEYVADIDSLVTCSNDGLIHFWDASEGFEQELEIRKTLNRGKTEHSNGVRTFCWCSDYRCLATCGPGERSITLWSAFGAKQAVLQNELGVVDALACNDQRNHLLTVTSYDKCLVWDLTNSKCIQTIDPLHVPNAGGKTEKKETQVQSGKAEKKRAVTKLHFEARSSSLVLGTRAMRVWRPKGAMVKKAAASHDAAVSAVAFNLTLRQVISTDVEGAISAWDLDTGEMSWTVIGAHGKGNTISCCCVESTGSVLLTGAADGVVRMWNLANGTPVKTFVKQRRGEITQLKHYVQRGNSYLIGVGWDRAVTVWADDRNFEDGTPVQPLHTMEGHKDDIRCLALAEPKTPNGMPNPAAHLLATGSDDGEIRIWDCDTLAPKWLLVDPDRNEDGEAFDQQGVEQLAFLAASGFLVSCNAGQVLRFWAAFEPSHQLLHRQDANHRPGENIISLNASQCGDQLISADSSGHLKLWDVSMFNKQRSGFAAITGTATHSMLGTKSRASVPTKQRFDAGQGAKSTLHMKAHGAAISAAMFIEGLDDDSEGADASPTTNTAALRSWSVLRQKKGVRRTSGQQMAAGGFFCTAAGDGSVSLWVRRSTARAKAGALVGTFSRDQDAAWKIHDASTFACLSNSRAVDDAKVKKEAEWESRSSYPKAAVLCGSEYLSSTCPSSVFGGMSFADTASSTRSRDWSQTDGSGVGQLPRLPVMPQASRGSARPHTSSARGDFPPRSVPRGLSPNTTLVSLGLGDLSETFKGLAQQRQRVLAGPRPPTGPRATTGSQGSLTHRPTTSDGSQRSASLAFTPRVATASIGSQSARLPPTAGLRTGKVQSVRTPRNSSDGVFLFKRLPTQDVQYDDLLAAPEIRRSADVKRIFENKNNAGLLRAHKKKKGPRRVR